MNPERSDWLNGLVKAAEIAVTKTKKPDAQPYRHIGVLEAAPERGPGWYRCESPPDFRLERLEEAVLAPASGPKECSYQVIDAAAETPWLYVQAASNAPDKGMQLWAPGFDARQLAEDLRDSLRNMPRSALAERFSTRTLDPIPAGAAVPGLHGAQAEAFRACCAPGLQLIWGPPGTGKTHVIAKAVSALLAQGKTVLLVSNTNVAVDNAVEKIATEVDPQPGVIVRVGAPVVPTVAKDHRVALPLLVQAKQAVLIAKIADLSDRLDRLGRDGRLDAVAKAERQLSEFDIEGYSFALIRLSNQRTAVQAQAAVAEAEEQWTTLTGRRNRAAGVALKANWIALRAEELAADAALTEIEQDLAHLESLSRFAKLRKKVNIAAARHHLKGAKDRQVEARSRRRDMEIRCQEQGGDSWALADESACRVEPLRARQQWKAANAQFEQVRDQASAAEARHREAVKRFTAACAEPLPTDDDRSIIKDAEQQGIPLLEKELPRLREAAAAVRKEIERTQRDLNALEEQRAKLRRNAEALVVKEASVVACTLAAMARRQPIRERTFDFVIVDEAAACRLPELVNAVGRAETGAVLVGDYLQNGPIVEPQLLKEDGLRRYYQPDCFTHFSLTEPATARSHPGCAVLDEQRRFGAPVTGLVNRAVYDGILKLQKDEGGEIVLIDVDGLSEELTNIRRTGAYKGHWPIGALIAKAIAEHHRLAEQTVGIVTPFKDQERATKSLMDGSPHRREVEVGTAHSFQGREFDMVVFDMVEDGKGHIANASRDGTFALGGLRIFNVGVTRARQRTYLIAQGGAVQRATRGPLAAVREGLRRGVIRSLSARQVLGIDEPVGVSDDSAFLDVRKALQDYVKINGTYDQATIFQTLITRIDEARESVWFWCPWIGKQNQLIQDCLVDAAVRGIAVTVVTRPERELNAKQWASSLAFQNRFPGRVVFQVKMHQKIVVVDRRWAFTGSMNLLSARDRVADRSKEFMMEIEDVTHSVSVLDQEKATDLLNPPKCAKCRKPMRNVDIRGRGNQRAWTWICDLSGQHCKAQTQFTHSPVPHVT